MHKLKRDTQTVINEEADILIIGGGATGLGCAVDGASRGYKTVLVEKDDFGSGTSSKSTKLVHGGVRYLEQGNVFLVQEALLERGRLLRNAPHLVHDLPFIIPNYSAWRGPYYLTGLKMYDFLAGKKSLGTSRLLKKNEVQEALPNIQRKRLRNGILYHDGQFDDTRLLTSLLRTFHQHGGLALNYTKAQNFIKDKSGKLIGLLCRDKETKLEFDIRAKVIINATGVYTERVQKVDDEECQTTVSPSQGSHLVLDQKFLGGKTAIMIPKTPDGRVLFAIPWHGRTVVGTTDSYTKKITNHPKVTAGEISFILETAGRYLYQKPTHKDILSVFAGIRPLVSKAKNTNTKAISRSHSVAVSPSGLVSIMGGKWTTYRKMGEDTIDKAIKSAGLKQARCKTKRLLLDGAQHFEFNQEKRLQVYGSNASVILKMEMEHPVLNEKIHPDLPYTAAQVVYASEYEMARTVEDVLMRRTRATFLHAKAAIEASKKVAALMKSALNKTDQWEKEQISEFKKVAKTYVVK